MCNKLAYTRNYWTDLSDALIDTTVGDYQFVQDLGHGSYGGLFLGQHMHTQDYVAIKVLGKSGLTPEQRQLQQLEIDIQSKLKHPSLLALHSVLQDQDYIYMVMDLCDQGDLFDYVLKDQGHRPESVVIDIFVQICQGIAHMHSQGIYHRDIKLENILLKGLDDDDEGGFECKVADFGLATRDRMSYEFGCGSAMYLAPEHFSTEDDEDAIIEPYDAAASDVWSLGILLLALMFGRNPWQEANLADPVFTEYKRHPVMLKHTLFPDLSLELLAWLQQAVLNPDPRQRVSVSDLLKQFQMLPALYDDGSTPLTPVDIPMAGQEKKDLGKPRYDSAFFSMEGGGLSWSDMVEEDLGYMNNDNTHCYDDDSIMVGATHDDDDTDMFVHNEEKESWWL
ncbi:kinase-like domain-containing protein [Chlamydoabsidia padenii]|nr:kinase-like domain-containing protein [Chlamydoabsidia padenii]